MLEALRARIISGFIYMFVVRIQEGETSKIPQKLETVLKKVEEIENNANSKVCEAFGCKAKATMNISLIIDVHKSITINICSKCIDKFKTIQ